ncbi:MAG: MBL fold metallo-hydrolase [Blastocatellia bacterium]
MYIHGALFRLSMIVTVCLLILTTPLIAQQEQVKRPASRFDTPDRSIVISGDTNPAQATIDACHGCDILIHEVLTQEWLAKRPDFHNYAAKFHTTIAQLAELAGQAKPRLLILYHASIARRFPRGETLQHSR